MQSKIVKNSIYQYMMIIAQRILPLFTFPYLTRVLEPDGYAIVTYMTCFVVYFQYLVDYGFILSSTKTIAENKHNKNKIEQIMGMTTQCKIILCCVTILLFSIIIPLIELLRNNIIISYLYICPVLLSAFLPDYLFKGLEDMRIFTTRYFITKMVTISLTFALIRGKEDILYIPLLNILSSLIAIILTWFQIKKKYRYKMRFVPFHDVLTGLKESTAFFISTAATTAFSAFNTFMLGFMRIPSIEIGYWGAYYTLITSAQSLYSPIINSIYPHMAAHHDYKIIKKIFKIFFPLIIIAAFITLIFSEKIIFILCGEDYLAGIKVFRILIPLLIISFPILMMNTPILGATGHVKESAKLTFYGASFHVSMLILMAFMGFFTLENVAILRILTECVLFGFVIYYVKKETAFFDKQL